MMGSLRSLWSRSARDKRWVSGWNLQRDALRKWAAPGDVDVGGRCDGGEHTKDLDEEAQGHGDGEGQLHVGRWWR